VTEFGGNLTTGDVEPLNYTDRELFSQSVGVWDS
jgi:hypothetical protein